MHIKSYPSKMELVLREGHEKDIEETGGNLEQMKGISFFKAVCVLCQNKK